MNSGVGAFLSKRVLGEGAYSGVGAYSIIYGIAFFKREPAFFKFYSVKDAKNLSNKILKKFKKVGLFLKISTYKLSFRCEFILGEFLKDIKKNHSTVNFAAMVNNLVHHSQSEG